MLPQDKDWLIKAIELERELDCDVSAGYDYGENLGKLFVSLDNLINLDKASLIIREELGALFDDREINIIIEKMVDVVCDRYTQKLSTKNDLENN